MVSVATHMVANRSSKIEQWNRLIQQYTHQCIV
eukprot:COSAG02_NODE_15609_length_1156_cov_1.197729_1_plen_32_part_10